MIWLGRIAWGVTILYWIALATATHLPPEDVHIPPSIGDKAVHAGAYFGLALLVGTSLLLTSSRRALVPLLVILIAMAYGAIDEWTQPIFNRACELADWIADLIGASTAAVVLFAVGRILGRRRINADGPS